METRHFALEKEFLQWVIGVAELHHWIWYHDYDSRKNPAGLPDLVMVRGNRLIFAELKMGKRPLRDKQTEWKDALQRTACEYYLWRPVDCDDIVRLLK